MNKKIFLFAFSFVLTVKIIICPLTILENFNFIFYGLQCEVHKALLLKDEQKHNI